MNLKTNKERINKSPKFKVTVGAKPVEEVIVVAAPRSELPALLSGVEVCEVTSATLLPVGLLENKPCDVDEILDERVGSVSRVMLDEITVYVADDAISSSAS